MLLPEDTDEPVRCSGLLSVAFFGSEEKKHSLGTLPGARQAASGCVQVQVHTGRCAVMAPSLLVGGKGKAVDVAAPTVEDFFSQWIWKGLQCCCTAPQATSMTTAESVQQQRRVDGEMERRGLHRQTISNGNLASFGKGDGNARNSVALNVADSSLPPHRSGMIDEIDSTYKRFHRLKKAAEKRWHEAAQQRKRLAIEVQALRHDQASGHLQRPATDFDAMMKAKMVEFNQSSKEAHAAATTLANIPTSCPEVELVVFRTHDQSHGQNQPKSARVPSESKQSSDLKIGCDAVAAELVGHIRPAPGSSRALQRTTV